MSDVPLFNLNPVERGLRASRLDPLLLELCSSVVGQRRGSLIDTLHTQLRGRVFSYTEVADLLRVSNPDVRSAAGLRSILGSRATAEILGIGAARVPRPGLGGLILFDSMVCSIDAGRFAHVTVAGSEDVGTRGCTLGSARTLFLILLASVVEESVPCDFVCLAASEGASRVISLLQVHSMDVFNHREGRLFIDPFVADQEYTGTPLSWARQYVTWYCEQEGAVLTRREHARARTLCV
jgi:hypothetical protein